MSKLYKKIKDFVKSASKGIFSFHFSICTINKDLVLEWQLILMFCLLKMTEWNTMSSFSKEKRNLVFPLQSKYITAIQK